MRAPPATTRVQPATTTTPGSLGGMAAPLRTLLAATIAVVLLAACGVSDGDDAASVAPSDTSTSAPASTTEDPAAEEEPSAFDEEAVESMVDVYTELGLSEEQARCMAEGLVDAMGEESFDIADQTATMDLINECDISMSELLELGGQTDGTLEGGFVLGLKTSLENQGLTEEEAQCVAEAYLDEYGPDPSVGQDPAALAPLFEACGVS